MGEAAEMTLYVEKCWKKQWHYKHLEWLKQLQLWLMRWVDETQHDTTLTFNVYACQFRDYYYFFSYRSALPNTTSIVTETIFALFNVFVSRCLLEKLGWKGSKSIHLSYGWCTMYHVLVWLESSNIKTVWWRDKQHKVYVCVCCSHAIDEIQLGSN